MAMAMVTEARRSVATIGDRIRSELKNGGGTCLPWIEGL